MFSTEDKVLIV